MRFWLDVHLDPRLADWIAGTFGIAATSFDELGYRRTADRVIFADAKSLGEVVIITKDSDFVALVQRLDRPPQVLWLTFGNARSSVVKSVLLATMPMILRELDAGVRFMEIAHA